MTSSPQKKSEVNDGYTVKYHANGKTIWSKGKIIDGQPDSCLKLNEHLMLLV